MVEVKSGRGGLEINSRHKEFAPNHFLNKLKEYYAPKYYAGIDLETGKVCLKPYIKMLYQKFQDLQLRLTTIFKKLKNSVTKDYYS